MLKKLLDWYWLVIILLIVNLGLFVWLSSTLSQLNEENSNLTKDQIILINENQNLREKNRILMIRSNAQQGLIESQQNLIERYRRTLEWIRENVLPQPEPEYDPDTIA